MRCEACGTRVEAGVERCAICGQSIRWLPQADAARATAERAAGEVFVGRAQELAVLRAALVDALAGHGRLLLLVGDPGIGKTRLAAELAALGRTQGARVLVGRAWETEGAPPFWPWTQVVRAHLSDGDVQAARADIEPYALDLARLMPELGALLPGLAAPMTLAADQARFRFFESFSRFLHESARRQALVLILDDLHWFDAPSLRLLEFLAREVASCPMLILGTYRDAGLGGEHPLLQVVGALVREPTCRSVPLSGLGADEVARFIERAAGEPPPSALVEAITGATEGNPFFLTEVVRLWLSEGRPVAGRGSGDGAPFPVPHGVRAAIARRLQTLSAPCRKVLLLAAMLGREFGAPSLDALGAEYGVGPTGDWLLEALEEAVDARLIALVPQAVNRYAFSHALIREALYEELNPARRARLHRDIALVLERLAAGDRAASAGSGVVLAELAYHHFQAIPAGGDADRAIDCGTRAGDWAMAVLAYEEAVPQYRRALAALDVGEPDESRRCELLLRLGQAYARAGDAPAARETFERSAILARGLRADGRATAALLFGRAVLGLGGEWWLESEDPDARFVEMLEEALDGMPPGDSELRARLMSRLAVALYFVPQAHERRVALSQQAVDMARRIDEPVTLAVALNSRHWAFWSPGHVNERLAAADELLRLAESIAARELQLQAHAWRIGDLLERGDIDAVDAEIERFARLAAELRQPTYVWWVSMFRAMRALLDGRLSEAERLAEEGMSVGHRVQGRVALAIFGGYLVWVRRAQGRLAELDAVVRGMVDQNPQTINRHAVLAFMATDLGRPAEAREEFERLAARDFSDVPLDLRWLPTMAVLAQVAAALGDRARAARLYDLLRPHAGGVVVGASGAGPCLGSVSRYLGLLATALGRWDDAEAHFKDAIAVNARMRARPLVAMTQFEYGAMLSARDRPGDSARAGEFVAAAHAAARDLDMASLRDRIEALGPPDADLRRPEAASAIRARDNSRPALAARAPAGAAPSANVFRRDGEYWTLVYEAGVSRLKDAKGLHYLAALIHRPEREFHVLDLAAITDRAAPSVGRGAPTADQLAADDLHLAAGSGQTSAILDARARDAYKRRVGELRDELAQAERFNDVDRATRLREEIDFVSGELSAAYGFGARVRKAAGADEQVRKNVTNCIRNSVARISRSNPALGRHLLAAVKTGVFCAYRPERPVTWES